MTGPDPNEVARFDAWCRDNFGGYAAPFHRSRAVNLPYLLARAEHKPLLQGREIWLRVRWYRFRRWLRSREVRIAALTILLALAWLVGRGFAETSSTRGASDVPTKADERLSGEARQSLAPDSVTYSGRQERTPEPFSMERSPRTRALVQAGWQSSEDRGVGPTSQRARLLRVPAISEARTGETTRLSNRASVSTFGDDRSAGMGQPVAGASAPVVPCRVSADGMPSPGCQEASATATLREVLLTAALSLLLLGSWLVLHHLMFNDEPEDDGRVLPGYRRPGR